MAEQDNEQQGLDELERALGPEGTAEAAAPDVCAIYRRIPQSAKDALGRLIERRLGPAAKRFYDALISIADKCCREGGGDNK